MKTSRILSLLVILSGFAYAQGVWTQKANFPSNARWGANSFSLNGKAYLGMGYDGSINYADLWEYNTITNSWTQKASANSPRRTSTEFTINNKGYIACGIGNSGLLNDLIEYDPILNTWNTKASLPDVARYGSAGFGIGNKGYVVCGNEGSSAGPFNNDTWEYDAVTNTWTAKANFPGAVRYGMQHAGFAVNGKGYAGLGGDAITRYNDFYEFDPVANTWTAKANYPGNGRSYPCGFNACYRGYMGTGHDGPPSNDFWKYEPVSNTWTQVANFGGGLRWIMAGCVVDNKIYAGTGYDGNNNYYNDWWEYTCENYGFEDEAGLVNYAKLYPSSFSEVATLEIINTIAAGAELEIYDVRGALLRSEKLSDQKTVIRRGSLSAGSYLYAVTKDGQKIGWGKMIVY